MILNFCYKYNWDEASSFCLGIRSCRYDFDYLGSLMFLVKSYISDNETIL